MAPSDPASDVLTAPPPAPLRRPALARWIWERGLAWREAGDLFGKSHEYVRRLCLPFGDPMRKNPDEATRATIAEVTRGAVPPPSFDAADAVSPERVP